MIRWSKTRLARYYWAGLIALLLLALMAWAWIPDVNDFLRGSPAASITFDQHVLENFIRFYGAQAVVMSFFLMILQATVAPLPAFVITFANASLFGTFWDGILSWSSVMADATLCFFIARILGRGTAEELTGKTVLDSMDTFVERHSKHTIPVCRLLPFIPLDPASHATDLTSIRFRHFLIAVGTGRSSVTVIYSWAGGLLVDGTLWFMTGLFILFTLSVVVSIVRSLYPERQRKKGRDLPLFLAMEILCVTAYCV